MTKTLEKSIVEPKNPKLNASRNRNLPHSPGVRIGDYICLSGMVALNPETGERFYGPIGEQIRMVLNNMRHMLESAGSSMERIVRIQMVLDDPLNADEMERVYREFFPVDPPARTFFVMQLRSIGSCEIECFALAGT